MFFMFKIFWIWEKEEILENNKDLDKIQIDESQAEVWQIALDILENNYEITVVAPIAWVGLEDINITLNKSVLTISGERVKPSNAYNISETIVRSSECFWWKFIRNIILPENLDFDTINAVMENNLLVIKISKLKFNTKEVKIDKIEG